MNDCSKAPAELNLTLPTAKLNHSCVISCLHYIKVDAIVECVRQKTKYSRSVQKLDPCCNANRRHDDAKVTIRYVYLRVVVTYSFTF